MKISDASWIFLDTETTGLKVSEGARVIEVGLVDIQNMAIGFSVDYLINPGGPIPPKITQLTGITDQMVARQGAFDTKAKAIMQMLQGADFIAAYNKDFDRQMLENEFKLVGMTMPDKIWLDPMTWARFFINLESNTLKNVATQFKVSLENAHRADADAEASAKMMIKFIEWGTDQADFPDDVDQLKSMERDWRRYANDRSKVLRPLRQKSTDPVTGKITNKVVTTGKPGEMTPDIYDSVQRGRVTAEEHLRLLQREKWSRRK